MTTWRMPAETEPHERTWMAWPSSGYTLGDHSYVNHLVVNGGVIACTFDDPHDREALEILGRAYPGREVVGVDARALFDRGGGIHCVTAQQPTAHRLA